MSRPASASASVRSHGPQLKDFIFTDKLGRGTYATVYKAYRRSGVREVVAIKCVEKSSLNKASTENLLTEIKLLKTLKHEHIVELKDFQWDDQYIYLIMEYCCGGDLSQFIRTNRIISEYVTKKFLQQLASALQYMRSKKVSHLDLKPQNLLLSSNKPPFKLKVGDFGFAHYLIGSTDAPHLRGSPLYMAPEIIIKRHYNEKADLWSVGVILYVCLFGRAPFESQSLQQLEDKIVATTPIEIPYGVRISRNCKDLLLKLLTREPEDRIEFDDFFRHPFVDLDHKPSDESLKLAIDLVEKAVRLDNMKKYHSAVALYCKALEHFISAIHYENDSSAKQALREKVKEYMNRAEELKVLLRPKQADEPDVGASSVEQEQNKPTDLVSLCADSPKLSAVLTVIKAAESLEDQDNFEGALQKYEVALGGLINALKEEPKGRRKDILQKKASVWMSQAERIKTYLEVKKLKTQDRSTEEELNSNEDESQCVVQ